MMQLEKIPQPKPIPGLGNIRDVDPHAFTSRIYDLSKTYGPIYKLDVLGNTMVILNSFDYINEASDQTKFGKSVVGPLLGLQQTIGNGLFTAHTHDPEWGIAHRVLMPAFSPAGIRDMYPGMLDIAEQMFVRWERFGEDVVLDAPDQFTRATLDTIALCGFDYRFNSFYQNEMHPFVEAMFVMLDDFGSRSRQPQFMRHFLRKKQQLLEESVALMDDICAQIIEERRNDPLASQKKDLLSRMLDASDPQTGRKLSQPNIRSQMVTFLIAGHETTSSLLSFATYLMLENPRVLKKAQQEVDHVLGRRTPTAHDLNRLPYLRQVMQEALRLYPTAPGFFLAAHEPTTLGEKYEILPEHNIVVSLRGLHRDAAIWGADAEVFRPERFSPAEIDQIPENGYKPFGNGMRACIGQPFALQEAHLILTLMLQRFEISKADPNYTLKIKEMLTLKPEGFNIRAKRRGGTWVHRGSSLEAMHTAAPHATGPNQTFNAEANPLLVLYGSNTGTADSFARTVATQAAARGYTVTIDTLDAYAGRLDPATPTVIVTASYSGRPTDNAKGFVTWLDTALSSDLAGLPFTVFGCGNTLWRKTYQSIPIKIEKQLHQAGAIPFYARGAGDANVDIFADFDNWLAHLWPRLADLAEAEEIEAFSTAAPACAMA